MSAAAISREGRPNCPSRGSSLCWFWFWSRAEQECSGCMESQPTKQRFQYAKIRSTPRQSRLPQFFHTPQKIPFRLFFCVHSQRWMKWKLLLLLLPLWSIFELGTSPPLQPASEGKSPLNHHMIALHRLPSRALLVLLHCILGRVFRATPRVF